MDRARMRAFNFRSERASDSGIRLSLHLRGGSIFLRNENLEVRRTLRARINRPVSEDEGRAWCDNRLRLVQEGT